MSTRTTTGTIQRSLLTHLAGLGARGRGGVTRPGYLPERTPRGEGYTPGDGTRSRPLGRRVPRDHLLPGVPHRRVRAGGQGLTGACGAGGGDARGLGPHGQRDAEAHG